jgi:hypothetical protein
MSVPGPTREDAARRALLRRLAYLGAVAALTGAFALSLSGIASTEATLRPDGPAAELAAKERSVPVEDRGCRHDRSRWRDGSRRV